MSEIEEGGASLPSPPNFEPPVTANKPLKSCVTSRKGFSGHGVHILGFLLNFNNTLAI
jgi:hypothetical protein